MCALERLFMNGQEKEFSEPRVNDSSAYLKVSTGVSHNYFR